MSQTYTIQLPQFEGPFDLLLFFIERDELDIHDIPIAKLTNDFLEYVRAMERMDIDLASEFILVAATLCRIKAKMLIPRKQLDEEGNEIDPREELVQRLLEYKRYKSIIEEMRAFEESRQRQQHRGNISTELKKIATKALADVELESLTLFKILQAYEKVLLRSQAKPKMVHRVYQFNYTIKEQQDFIFRQIQKFNRANFAQVFESCENRIHAIVTFLGLLELVNLQRISIVIGEGINNFWIEKNPTNRNEESYSGIEVQE